MTRLGLAPTRIVLENGVAVIARETRKTPAVTLNLAVRAGSICDPEERPGASYLLSKVIDRGTARKSADDITEELESRGTALAVTVTRHLVTFVCTCLADDFEVVLALLGDIVRTPSLPDAEIAVRKGEVITGLRQDEDNPAIRAMDGLMALLYGPVHPYGRHARGTPTSIEALTRDDLAALHQRRFTPAATSLVVVGDVETRRAAAVANDVFGPWSVGAASPVVVSAPRQVAMRRRVVVPMMNKAQTEIAYGFTTITRADPQYYAFWLLNNVFGQYALGGRLGDTIRERHGMAYHVSSAFDPNLAEGPLVIRAGVSAANVDRAIQSIDDEVSSLVREGVTDKELQESRQYMIGSMPRAHETNHGIAQFLQNAEFFGLGLDYDVRLPELLGRLTRAELHGVAQRYLSAERATIVVAGPYQE